MESVATGSAYILTVDDHPLFRSALRLAIGKACPETLVVEAASLSEARLLLRQNGRPVLALLDLSLPDSEGFGGLIDLRVDLQGAPVAIVSGDESPDTVSAVMRLGAAGFIPKSSTLETIVDAVTHLVAGLSWAPDAPPPASAEAIDRIASLTLAQQRVLVGLQKGLLNKQIAFDSGISEATVKAHMTAIFRKLGVQSRTQAVLAAQRYLNPGSDQT
jgi:DNA-binding NarL/FixJ family response regulator